MSLTSFDRGPEAPVLLESTHVGGGQHGGHPGGHVLARWPASRTRTESSA